MKKTIIFLYACLLASATHAALPTPAHSSPANGIKEYDPFGPFYISGTSRAAYDSVQFEFDTSLAFNTNRRITSIRFSAGEAFSRISGLRYKTLYYWRCRGFKSGDSSAWSSAWSVTTSEGKYTIYQNPSFVTDRLCIEVYPIMPGEFYEYEIDVTPQFNSPKLKRGRVLRHCTSNCEGAGYKIPWDTNYVRIRSAQTTSTGPWSNVVKEFVKPAIILYIYPGSSGDEYIYNTTLASLHTCNVDKDTSYFLYHDTTDKFNSPLLKEYKNSKPGMGTIKLVPHAMNYFRSRHRISALGIDTLNQTIYKIPGPSGIISFSQKGEDLQNYQFNIPDRCIRLEMEFDTVTTFNTARKFRQTHTVKGGTDLSVLFFPVTRFVRQYMRYRVITDSTTYPWVLSKNSRILTPNIALFRAGGDTVIDINPGYRLKRLDSAQFYYFETDRTPAFNPATKKTMRFNVSQMNSYWYPEILNFSDTVYVRGIIKTPRFYTDWTPTFRYSPLKRVLFNVNKTSLNSPYLLKPSPIPNGVKKIQFEIYKDTQGTPLASPLYCLNNDNQEYSANPAVFHFGPTFVRVRYANDNEFSGWSPYRLINYTADNSIPLQLSPMDCASGTGGYVTLRWRKIPSTQLYKVNYSWDLSVSNSNRTTWTTDTMVTVYLAPSRSYWWSVSSMEATARESRIAKWFLYTTNSSIATNINIPTGDQHMKANLFPNPASARLFIESDCAVQGVQIYSSSGIMVDRFQFDRENAMLDVSGLNPGLYTCRIYTACGSSTNKFIKVD